MAQVAEHILGKDEVTSSNLVSSSKLSYGIEALLVYILDTVVRLNYLHNIWMVISWEDR